MTTATNKLPYRVPTMAEISALPRNGFNFARSPFSFDPKWNGVIVPARQAYSHSVSVGSSTFRFTPRDTLLQNAAASSHDTLSTGNRPPLNLLGSAPITGLYWACDTSYFPG